MHLRTDSWRCNPDLVFSLFLILVFQPFPLNFKGAETRFNISVLCNVCRWAIQLQRFCLAFKNYLVIERTSNLKTGCRLTVYVSLLHTLCKHMMKSILLLAVLQKKKADERCSHNVHWMSHFSAKIRLSEQNFSFNFLKTIFVLSD